MSNTKSQRRGLALGSVIALFGSLFVGAQPAQAAATNAFYIAAAGADTTTFATFVDDDFTLIVERNAAVVAEGDMTSYLHYEVTTNRTYNTSYSIAVTTVDETNTNPVDLHNEGVGATVNAIYYGGVLQTNIYSTISGLVGAVPATESYVIAPASVTAGQSQKIAFRLTTSAGITSTSPGITITVRPFLDLNGNNKFDSATEDSAVQTITFAPYSAVTRTVSVGALDAGDINATASAVLSGVNFGQISGSWALRVNQHGPDGKIAATSYSAVAPMSLSSALAAAGRLSTSMIIPAASGSYTVSAQLVLVKPGYALPGRASGGLTDTSDDPNQNNVIYWAPQGTVTIGTAKAASLGSLYAVESANAVLDSGSDYDVRPNTLVTVRASFSGVVSSSEALATFRFTGVTLGASKTMSVNGGAAQNTATHSAVTAVINKTTGVAEITLLTSGFGASDTLTVHASTTGVAESSITLDNEATTWTLSAVSYVATPVATAFALKATVKDQWGELSTNSDQRVKFTWATGYSGTATVSNVAVSGGSATATLTPSRTPSTGSSGISVTMDLEYLNGTIWTDDASATLTTNVVVTDAVNAFRTGLAASYSASISYGTNYSWSSAINTAYVLVTGSPVVVSGAGLMFQDANDATSIGTDSLTLPGNASGQAAFKVTARKAGSYVVTLTSGAATTTSLIVVSPARSDQGASIEWDTTTITAGTTRIVTGTLLDANGNPVDTTAPGQDPGGTTASIVVTYTGTAGIPVGTMPTETDADGKFRVSILTSTADSGTFTLTATYLPQGAGTAAAAKVTSANAITVGTGASSSEQKVNAGSFKGYVAVYAKGYEGQRMSAKIGNDWVVVESLASNFERVVDFTGAGYTIAVRIYIDRVLVDTITVTTK